MYCTNKPEVTIAAQAILHTMVQTSASQIRTLYDTSADTVKQIGVIYALQKSTLARRNPPIARWHKHKMQQQDKGGQVPSGVNLSTQNAGYVVRLAVHINTRNARSEAQGLWPLALLLRLP